jgi:hypothetical protein
LAGSALILVFSFQWQLAVEKLCRNDKKYLKKTMKKLLLLLLLSTSFAFSQQTKFQKIDSLLTFLNTNNKFMGELSIIEKGKMVFSKAYGFADVESGKKLDENTKTQWMNKWSKTPECFHIHCPDGSTGKEGPSAGAAMTLAFYSRLVNKKINHLVAMTGEINLREEVTEIGGLDEKLNAAKRGGATKALIPYNNKIDLGLLPAGEYVAILRKENDLVSERVTKIK